MIEKYMPVNSTVDVSGSCRFGNHVIRNIAAHCIAKQNNIKMTYSFYEEIKQLGIDLFIGENTYEDTMYISDLNLMSIIKYESELQLNLYINNHCYCQTPEFSQYLRTYLQSIQSSIIEKNPQKERYATNNDLFVHVRLGDLLDMERDQHKKCYHPFEYYDKVCSSIQFEKGYIASDSLDHSICQRLIEKYKLIPVIQNEIDTIQFGSTCKHIVLSPGTFSYLIGVLGFFSTIYYSNDGIYTWHGDIFVFPDWNKVII